MKYFPLLFLILCFSCSNDQTPANLTDTRWQLVAVHTDQTYLCHPLHPDGQFPSKFYSLEFENQYSDMNIYPNTGGWGVTLLDAQKLQAAKTVATEIAAPPPIHSFNMQIDRVLVSASSYNMTDVQLIISGPNGFLEFNTL